MYSSVDCGLVITGRRCLELGCGAGVVGVALRRTGAASVTLTDGNDAAVENCKHNLDINKCMMPCNGQTVYTGNHPQVLSCLCAHV